MFALLASLPSKDWKYIGIIVALLALLIGGSVEWHKHDVHEQAIGAAHEVAAITAAQKTNQKKVDAINSHNQIIENQANAQIQALSGALATANTDLASRMQHDASQGRSEFMPATSCASIKPSDASAAPSRTSSPPEATGPIEVTAPKQVIEDDLTIALDHNEQLQAIIKEFQQAQSLGK